MELRRIFTTESEFVKKKMKGLLGGLAVVVMSLFGVPAKAWTITDLGDLGTSGSGGPYALNNSGQVTGQSRTTGGAWHAFLYSGGTMTDLGTLGGATSVGASINESGTVAGYSDCSSSMPTHPFIYSGGTMTDLFLATMPTQRGLGLSINSSGDVLISSRFLYSGGTLTDLTTVGMTTYDEVADINDRGQIAGKQHDPVTGSDTAFVYRAGTVSLLPGLGGDHSYSTSISQLGQVVGRSNLAGNTVFHAFLWTPTIPGGTSGSVTDMGVLPGDTESFAYDINAWGTAVGYSNFVGTDKAFMYTTCGGMVDLNTLLPPGSGWTLRRAYGINDKGQIIGIGDHTAGGWGDRFFLLSP